MTLHSDQVPRIAITMGDPAGVGPEVVVRALGELEAFKHTTLIVLGDEGVLKKAQHEVGLSVDLHRVKSVEQALPGQANLLALSNINIEDFRFGNPTTDLGLVSTFYIIKAADLALSGRVDAIVTCPINKAMLGKAGYSYTSHSEMLEAYTKSRHAMVLMLGEHLRVVRVTGHIPIRQVAEQITPERVLEALRLTHHALTRDLGLAEPLIAVCGLNPHAGEDGLFGHEDRDILAPAIEQARAEGMRLTGPLPADTLFPRARDGHYDAVLCMYHDQGHIAFRLIDFGVGVSVTLGLPIIRTAPDHGTAYDIAGKGFASEKSLVKAIHMAIRFIERRREDRRAAKP